ncbi:MAG: peptidoglycan DD-metalloendopeptidase family protein [Ginsengibacter sp.]|jgi:murein DD-endopeptidase MepM/ murein hydrolase activator NlpD
MTNKEDNLHELLKTHSLSFHPVIDFKPGIEKIISINFSHKNKVLEEIDFENTDQLSRYMNQLLAAQDAQYGFGGYGELRTIYSRSKLFNKDLGKEFKEEEPRRLHIGTDVWSPAGTPVYAPMDGRIHSFAFNDHFGDYGATLILKHSIDGMEFHTLYGHISLKDLEGLEKDTVVHKGDLIAHFGQEKENGYWPPHLHFQVINDMHGFEGDYPGVCKLSERRMYLQNCADPDIVLNLKRYIK